MDIEIPAGVKVFNRAETYQLNTIINKITNTFEKWAYEEIKLPVFEYFNVHKKALDENIAGKSFKIVDRTTGDILSLRADFTAQIARYFSSLKRKELPKRYYYKGSIFRYSPPKTGDLWEIFQTGVELIGSDRLEADAEVITIACNALSSIGIENFQIDLNNIKIFTGLKNILRLSEKEYQQFMQFIKNREIFNLKKFVSRYETPQEIKEFIVNIPKYQGGLELIQDLKKVVSNYPKLLEPLEELENIYNILTEYGVTDKVVFDLGEPREFSYYTGIVFEIFIKNFPKSIGQGGRYDNLISRYNGDIPATGFAFYVLNIWNYARENNLLEEKKLKDFFIIDLTPDKKAAYQIGKALKEKGYIVGRDIIDRDYEESLKFAFNNRYKKAIIIGLDTDPKTVYIYSTPEKYEKIKIQDLLEKI